MRISRYAIYYLPPRDARWSRLGRAWLGWDIDAGGPVAPPALPDDLPMSQGDITGRPRRYGLHATLKPPFRLAPGRDPDDLARCVRDLAAKQAPVTLGGLCLARMGRFLALCAEGETKAVDRLAAACVATPDDFRARPDAAELSRRHSARLSPAQAKNLRRWGYPHVMQAFRFHITLTGGLPDEALRALQPVLDRAFAPHLPKPLRIAEIALVGERADGHFQTQHRFPLGGRATR